MASFTIQFRHKIEGRTIVKEALLVHARKVTNAWMKRTYGKNWHDAGDVYKVSTKNKYGVSLISNASARWSIIESESLPEEDINIIVN